METTIKRKSFGNLSGTAILEHDGFEYELICRITSGCNDHISIALRRRTKGARKFNPVVHSDDSEYRMTKFGDRDSYVLGKYREVLPEVDDIAREIMREAFERTMNDVIGKDLKVWHTGMI